MTEKEKEMEVKKKDDQRIEEGMYGVMVGQTVGLR